MIPEQHGGPVENPGGGVRHGLMIDGPGDPGTVRVTYWSQAGGEPAASGRGGTGRMIDELIGRMKHLV